MALKIEHPEASSLARALAERTGESLTEAVINSLRERLQRERARDPRLTLESDLLRIQRRYSALPLLDRRSPDEILGYDEMGVPR